MPAQETKLNIVEEIGKNTRFWVLLLQDHRGTKLKSICENYDRFLHWIHGGGRTPVTWETLVEVLKEADLNTLASDIQSSLL